MREKILRALARLHAQHPWKILGLVVIITIIMGIFAGQLKQSMRWTDLLPTKSEKTVQYNKVINEFVTATSIIVVVEGGEERIKAFAEAVIPKIKLVTDPKDGKLYTKRIDYKQDIDFIRENGLMLIKADDLQNMKELYQNPNLVPLLTNINNSFEKEYIGQEESISTRTKEDNTIIILDSIGNLISIMKDYASGKTNSLEEAQKAVDKLLLGEPYMLSYDKQALIINVIPNFNMDDISKMVSGTDTIQKIIDEVRKDYTGVKAGLTGMIPLGRDEMVYAQQSMNYTSLFAFIAILILLILSFRMWTAFFALIISSSRGMREVGLVSSTGLLAILIVTFLFLPSLLVLRERRLEKKIAGGKIKTKPIYKDISFKSFGAKSKWLSQRYITTIIGAVVVTILLLISAFGISFDHNYMNMEPKGLTSITLQDTILDKFDLSMDYALILIDSVEESREMADKVKNIKSVAIVDDISMYLPSLEEQQKRIPIIQEINQSIFVGVVILRTYN
ncbi:hypothetical protein ES708_24776 [subsurface metagenome]